MRLTSVGTWVQVCIPTLFRPQKVIFFNAQFFWHLKFTSLAGLGMGGISGIFSIETWDFIRNGDLCDASYVTCRNFVPIFSRFTLSVVNEHFIAVDGTTKNRNLEAGFELGPVRFYTASSYVPLFLPVRLPFPITDLFTSTF